MASPSRPRELDPLFAGDAGTSSSSSSSELSRLLREREQLRHRLDEVVATTHGERSDDADVGRLQLSVAHLQDELTRARSDHDVVTTLLQRLQLSGALFQTLHPDDDKASRAGDGRGDGGDARATLAALVDYQAALSSAILAEEDGVARARREVDGVVAKRLTMKRENRAATAELTLAKEKRREAIAAAESGGGGSVRREKENLENVTAKIVVQRNMIQSLILGSGVHWAEDEELTEFLLSLGRPLNL
ncbi:PREDICTED: centromere protein H-like [Priapulus caudatus]|uniref:Centromere protein H-like n=1 Tax=Priapulus caudatus TaxID=37621 RepID=A0ABM1E8L8_PRICU|nr:PREDICTED: centromere protein H-like [Priapulus caudatus]